MENIWIEQFQPRHSEVDAQGRLKLKAFCDYLQEAAANHAHNLGWGMAYLQQQSLMWVLSRLKIRFLSTIKLGNVLTVKTYPSGVNKLFATREFEVLVNDRCVACGSSYWLVISAKNFRPLRVTEAIPNLSDNIVVHRFFSDIGKIVPLGEGGNLSSITQLIGDSLIDLNNHLNNAEYSAMVHNFLAQELGRTPEFSEFQINFIQATALGEEMKITGEVVENSFYVYGMVADSIRFQAVGKLF